MVRWNPVIVKGKRWTLETLVHGEGDGGEAGGLVGMSAGIPRLYETSLWT